jgi:hypothetical protein
MNDLAVPAEAHPPQPAKTFYTQVPAPIPLRHQLACANQSRVDPCLQWPTKECLYVGSDEPERRFATCPNFCHQETRQRSAGKFGPYVASTGKFSPGTPKSPSFQQRMAVFECTDVLLDFV